MKIALVGNQNSGKTTLFNCLTGMNAKIGNWPGVTIEKKVGKIRNTDYELIDLPGIYSLSPYTIEEKVSRNFIIDEKPDVIINIVDATSIERSLYLTTQLLELDCNVIIALNMSDLLEKKGLKINIELLEQMLGTKVVKISALKQIGIEELIKSIKKSNNINKIRIFDTNIENAITLIKDKVNIKNRRFYAIKLIEQDKESLKYKTTEIESIIKNIIIKYDTDLEEIIATQRYDFIDKIKQQCIIKTIINKESVSDKLDKVFLNKWIAFPIFILIMFLIYYLSVGVIGNITADFVSEKIDIFKEIVSKTLINFETNEILVSLVSDGIIAGVGSVLEFIPQLMILFICISILEISGYMSRIGLLLDKLFRKLGLNGKSIISFIVGSGCSVPGIMTSRTIENNDERKMTAILTPFIPCSAKLPIIALFSGYFFSENSGIVSASLYLCAIIVIILSAMLMKKFVYQNTSSTYISELPEYKIPDIRYVLKDALDKIISFVKRAGSVILLCSIIIWFLVSFSCDFKYQINIQESILAQIGTKISWLFTPMLGVNSWEATVSAIQGLIAKEQVVSSMSVISGLSQNTSSGVKMFAPKGVFSFFTPVSAYAFMLFNLFSAPCIGAIAAMRKELGGAAKVLKAIFFQTVLAWIIATLTYQIGSRLTNVSNIIVLSLILIIIAIVINSIVKRENNRCINCTWYDTCKK